MEEFTAKNKPLLDQMNEMLAAYGLNESNFSFVWHEGKIHGFISLEGIGCSK